MRFALGLLLLFTLAFYSTNAGYLGKKNRGDFGCGVCKNAVEIVIEDLGASDEETVLKTLLEFCREYAGDFAVTCESIVNLRIKEIMNYIQNHQSQAVDEICKAASLCD